MQVVLIILSVGLLGLIIYYAFSPKSSRLVRLVAIVALGFIVLTIGICGFFLIRGPAESKEAIPLPVFQDSSPQPVKNSKVTVALVFFAVIMLVLGAIIVISVRDQKKKSAAKKAAPSSQIFDDNDKFIDEPVDEPLLDDTDESFDIEN